MIKEEGENDVKEIEDVAWMLGDKAAKTYR